MFPILDRECSGWPTRAYRHEDEVMRGRNVMVRTVFWRECGAGAGDGLLR